MLPNLAAVVRPLCDPPRSFPARVHGPAGDRHTGSEKVRPHHQRKLQLTIQPRRSPHARAPHQCVDLTTAGNGSRNTNHASGTPNAAVGQSDQFHGRYLAFTLPRYGPARCVRSRHGSRGVPVRSRSTRAGQPARQAFFPSIWIYIDCTWCRWVSHARALYPRWTKAGTFLSRPAYIAERVWCANAFGRSLKVPEPSLRFVWRAHRRLVTEPGTATHPDDLATWVIRCRQVGVRDRRGIVFGSGCVLPSTCPSERTIVRSHNRSAVNLRLINRVWPTGCGGPTGRSGPVRPGVLCRRGGDVGSGLPG